MNTGIKNKAITSTVDNVNVVVPVTVEVTGGSSLSTNGSFTSNYAAGN